MQPVTTTFRFLMEHTNLVSYDEELPLNSKKAPRRWFLRKDETAPVAIYPHRIEITVKALP